jgi:hypothetical protein
MINPMAGSGNAAPYFGLDRRKACDLQKNSLKSSTSS